MIYLDYAANTKVDKEVLDTYYDTALNYYGNTNSNHEFGKKSKQLMEEATIKIAKYLNIEPEEIIYTSGATESNNLAIKGICERYKNYGKHILLSSLEHTSIIASATIMQELGFEVELIPVDKNGLINIETLKQMIRKDTILVSVCSVDSELGLVQPIGQIGILLKDYPNTYFHSDASQSIGKVTIDYTNVDLITIAPHKFYGTNDIGILVKKKNVGLKPIINGGRSTTVYRSGTPNLPGIVATSKAIELALTQEQKRYEYVKKLNKKIIDHLKTYDFIHINNTEASIPFTINFSIKNIKSQEVVDYLSDKEIYVSSKTSCCPIGTPSKLIYALTKDKSLASTSIRLSISHITTEKEIDTFINVFDNYIKELKENGKI